MDEKFAVSLSLCVGIAWYLVDSTRTFFPNQWLVVEAVRPKNFGLIFFYSYILIISSANKYRKHKSNMLICVLPIDE